MVGIISRIRLMIVAGLAIASLLILAPAAQAQSSGWTSGTGAIQGTAMAACQAQHDYYSPTSPFYGMKEGIGWFHYYCMWGPPPPLAEYVGYWCGVPYHKGFPPGMCLPTENLVEFRPDQILDDKRNDNSCDATSGTRTSSNNNGGGKNAATKNPIELSSGAKLFRVVDFETADGSLSLERVYNSLSYGNQDTIMKRLPLGIGNGWRFTFQHEIHLYTSSPYVELETAGGGSYEFTKSGSSWVPYLHGYAPKKQTDYTIEFVGTYPSTWSAVRNASTQWRLRDPQGREWLFQTYLYPGTSKYDIALPISVTFRGGLTWTFAYGSNNELTSITDSYGKSITFTWYTFDPNSYGASGAPIRPVGIATATVPDGTTFKYIQDSIVTSGLPINDRLIKVEHRDASNNLLDLTEYLHEDSSFPYHVTGIKDSAGTRRWTVEYNASGRAITSKGPSDVDKVSVTYGTPSGGTATRTVTNALGKDTVFTYNWLNSDLRLTGIAGSASAHCPSSNETHTFDSTTKFIATRTDAEGRVTSYTRNSIGQPTQIIDGYGTGSARTTGMTWHSTLNVQTQIVQPGLTTDFTWNSSGQLTQVTQTDTTSHSVPYSTNGQTRTWAYTYDSYGHLLTVNGPLSGSGDTVTYTYNSSGYLASITNEVGHVTTVSAVNGRGQPATIVDPNSVTSTLTYDSEGRVKTITVDPSGTAAVTSFDYNVVGDITKITRPNGGYLQYTRDDARRVTIVQDNTGASVEYDRNTLGNVTARRIKNSGGTTLLSQTATFDELGRLLTFVGAATQTWTQAYDKTDNLTTATDPRSHTFTRTFDSVNRLIRETDEVSAQVNLTLNGKDEVTNYADPRSLSTSYVRNGFGDAIRVASPDSGTTDTVYSALGKPTQITDGRGIVINLTYDNAGRMLTREYPAATSENITYTWDATASGNKGVGRITKIEDASGSVEWVYDVLGHATQEKKTTSSVVYTIAYSYDADGNVTEMTYPSGRIVTFSRDSIGRVSGVTTKKDSGSSTVTLASSVSYQPFGPLSGLIHGNGLVLAKTFTQDYRLDALTVQDISTSTTVIDRSHGFGDDVNLTAIADNITSARNESYVYTAANRLSEGVGIWGTLTWGYDGVGNRTSEVLTSGSTTTNTYSYPSGNNKLATVAQGSTTVRAFTHDGAGNVTADDRAGTVYNYTYNKRNRLAQSAVGATVKADYTYDALERLAIRATQNMTPSGTTHYVYDSSGHLIAESTGTGTTVREYVWLDAMPLAVVADIDTSTPNLYAVHADHLDRPLRMTDVSQAVVWDAVYKPFGEAHAITGAASNNLRFPGQYFLIESGLAYNWHRDYDPTIGRYAQPDPLGFVDGPSVFAYAMSAPTMEVDPEGRWIAVPIALGVAGFAIDAGLQYLMRGCVNWTEAAVTGVLSALGGGGGILTGGIKRAGLEFSHWIPKRFGGARNIWNGNFITPSRHYRNDPFRYPQNWENLGPKWRWPVQQLDRIPDIYKGAAVGTATGMAFGGSCSCSSR